MIVDNIKTKISDAWWRLRWKLAMRAVGVDYIATLNSARRELGRLQHERGLYRDALQKQQQVSSLWKHQADELQSLLKIQLDSYHELEAELETLKAQQIGWAEQCECVGGGQ